MSRIGIDIGGTFTDFTFVRDDGSVFLWKEDTNKAAPEQAILLGLANAAEALGRPGENLVADADLLVHGTTIGTNTLIQRNGPSVGLLCTAGFRDLVYLRDAYKPERFDVHMHPPQEFVDRYLRVGISERIDSSGEVLEPLDEEEVLAAARRFAEEGVAAIAIAFLWSPVNDAHERRAAEIIRAELPQMRCVLSSEVLPEIREWHRTSAATISAYMVPVIDRYLSSLEAELRDQGLTAPLLIMRNNGGCGSVADVLRNSATIVASGPAAAPAAALHHSTRFGESNVIVTDMGGTSFDVCLVRGGRASISREIEVAGQPLGVPGVEVHSIGAGGGSIAWVDSGGALKVGPQSAGAQPGPACYGRGGEHPTVTDANVILGRLNPESFLGGRRRLDAGAAEKAFETHVSGPLGIDVETAARGVIEVVETAMAGAIRAVSVERGIDPRTFVMVAGGGAGGLHANSLARRLEMDRIIIPKQASTLCAYGMTITDVRLDAVRTSHWVTDGRDIAPVVELFAELEAEVLARFRDQGFGPDEVTLVRFGDARYPGQTHDLTVALPSVHANEASATEEIAAAFHAVHHETYTYSRPELPVEFRHWRLTGSAGGAEVCARVEAPPSWRDLSAAPAASNGSAEGMRRLSSTEIQSGDRVKGPVVVEAETTTIAVEEGDALHAYDDCFVIERAANTEG